MEIVCEKSTVDDVLLPLSEQYEINVTCCVGEISVTRSYEIVQRAKASGRPCRILYLSDFDPAGASMPVACARKIEFFVRKENLDLDIQLRPIVLTHEQCEDYELPRTPLKDTETRAGRFEARYGAGATELDALEALHPGELHNILTEEIDRYYDTDLEEEINDIASGIDDEVDAVNDTIYDRYVAQIEALEDDYAVLEQRRRALWQEMMGALNNEAPDIDDTEWPDPCDGDEEDDPMYDSSRSYIDQVDRFKHHQGKEVNCFATRTHPETIALARKLRDEGLSYSKIGTALAKEGHLNSKGKKYAHTTILHWLQDSPTEDALSTWLEECCERDPSASTSSATLFASLTAWAARAGQPAGTKKNLADNLVKRGFERKRLGHDRGFAGISCKSGDGAGSVTVTHDP